MLLTLSFPRLVALAVAGLLALGMPRAGSTCLAADDAAANPPGTSLVILPATIQLRGPEDRQRLLVEQIRPGQEGAPQYLGQLTEGVTLASTDPKIAVVEEGVVRPVGNGQTTITATGPGGQTASIDVTVAELDRPSGWSFRNHVESVLTKTGCNSGACHGAIAGKKGFKLSLRAYDPERDFTTLTRQSLGRRIVPTDPGHSLLLLKPTGAIPHGGGVRFDVGSHEYRVLAEWIAQGTAPPADSDPRLDRLEILPEQAILRPGLTQQMLVRAHFTDGHVEDVTRWAKFTASNASVAEVDDAGMVRVMGHGEGAVTVWYLSRVVAATVSVPFAQDVAADAFTAAPRNNLIDELVLEKLANLNIPPSPPASDAEFLRRVMLDTIGLLPTVAESKAFLADTASDKRTRLIHALVERPEFVDYWSYKWSDLFLVNSEKLPGPAMWAYYNWIRNNVAANTPWDQFARELLTATGSTLENGAANFYVLHDDPRDLAETASVALLGMSINCARCHNHPLEKWTNGQYYGMGNLFARVRTKNAPGEGNRIIFCAGDGDLIQPLTGQPQPPCPLDGEALALDDPADRRVALAAWLTSPENPYFSRAIVNRVWANFFGVGLVESVDDLRLTNPASNPRLHQALAHYLAEQNFDLKALMRLILESSTYQRSSQSTPANAPDKRFYSHYYPRRLMAEVLLDAFAQVTAAPNKFPNYPETWRALQLPDSNVASYFLKTFGRPDRVITCECERAAEPSMVQVLHISNGDAINAKLEASGNRIDQLIAAGSSDEQIIDELYTAALCRAPSAEEKSQLLAALAESAPDAGTRRQRLEDLYWSVLSSKEFLFNH